VKLTRRQFLACSAGSLTGAALGVLGVSRAEAKRKVASCRITKAKMSTSVCCFCACGCGLIVHSSGGKVINIEGDPAHPINEGSLCSKGAALMQVAINERRAQKVLHRTPGSGQWKELSWDQALKRIAAKIRETRNTTFKQKDKGLTVNRTDGIGALGGAALDNEECYLYVKLARALGLVYIEHQARI